MDLIDKMKDNHIFTSIFHVLPVPPLAQSTILILLFMQPALKRLPMAAKRLLQVLLEVSEKSANIARAWRCQEELFELMIEEKTEKEKNKRFVQDFKTLADVLVQEVVKHDVTQNVS